MGKNHSFSGLEKQILHEFRNRVKLSEDPMDLEKLFQLMIGKLLRSDILIPLNIKTDDVVLDPRKPEGYCLADHLFRIEEFRQIYDHSDLRHVIGRFAHPISKRHTHLKKKPRRSDARVR